MTDYGQFCPIAKAAEVFCERWTAIVIRNIAAGATRFTDIHRGAPLMSKTLLSQRLKFLEAEGVVCRQRDGGRWSYLLTEKGEAFLPLVSALNDWGQRWRRSDPSRDDIDWGLLIWGYEHQVRPGAFGTQTVQVEFAFTDLSGPMSRVWYVCDGTCTDLCMTDAPGQTDLWLSATLVDWTRLYLGDISLDAARTTGALAVDGPPRLARRLSLWLNLSTAVAAAE